MALADAHTDVERGPAQRRHELERPQPARATEHDGHSDIITGELKTDPGEKAAQMEAVMKEIRGYSGSDNLVLVTHLENIEALTGIAPREGEAVVVAPEGDGLKVLGRVTF